MKTTLALLLIILLIMIALPMRMGEMGDCPMCTSTKTIALGICVGVLSLLVLVFVPARTEQFKSGTMCFWRDLSTRLLPEPVSLWITEHSFTFEVPGYLEDSLRR